MFISSVLLAGLGNTVMVDIIIKQIGFFLAFYYKNWDQLPFYLCECADDLMLEHVLTYVKACLIHHD